MRSASVRSLSFSFCPVFIVAGVAPGLLPVGIALRILAQQYWRGDLAVDTGATILAQ